MTRRIGVAVIADRVLSPTAQSLLAQIKDIEWAQLDLGTCAPTLSDQ